MGDFGDGLGTPSSMSSRWPGGIEALPGYYERLGGQEEKGAVASDNESIASDASYEDAMKACKQKLKAQLLQERKALAAAGAMSLASKFDDVIKDLGGGQSFAKSPTRVKRTDTTKSGQSVGPLNTFASLNTFTSEAESERGGLSSATASWAVGGNADAEADIEPGAREDYDSDDEEGLRLRYEYMCNASSLGKLRDALSNSGFEIPQETANERKKRLEKGGKAKQKKQSAYQKELQREVDKYQQLMRERLEKLGVPTAKKERFKKTTDPAAAVRDGVLRYHKHCEDLNKFYAFSANDGRDDLELEEKQRLARLVRDLQEEDPDRYAAAPRLHMRHISSMPLEN